VTKDWSVLQINYPAMLLKPTACQCFLKFTVCFDVILWQVADSSWFIDNSSWSIVFVEYKLPTMNYEPSAM